VVRRVLLTGVALALVLVGYTLFQAAFPSPEATVKRYFNALADRDMVQADEQLSGTAVLEFETHGGMWSALIDRRYQPPTGVQMGGWQRSGTGAERVVAVQYELGGVTHSSLLRLHREGSAVWRITNGLGTVAVNLAGTAVNGQRLTTSKSLRLFPGIYELGTAPNAPMVTAAPVTVVVTPDRAETAELRATLTDAGVKAVKQRMDALLIECERTSHPAPPGCPFSFTAIARISQVKWTIISRPELVIEQVEPGVVSVRGAGPGSVRLSAVDPGGATVGHVDTFPVNGKCVEADGKVSCTFIP